MHQQPRINELTQMAAQGDKQALIELQGIAPERAAQVINTQGVQQQQGAQAQEQKLRSISQGAFNVQSIPSVKGKIQALQQRLKGLPEGSDTSHTNQVLELYRSGRTDEADDLVNRAVTGGERMGFLKAQPKESQSNIGAVSPKDFTVQSMGLYEQSGNIKDLVRFSPKVADIAGVKHQLNSITQKWEPIVDATSKTLSKQAKAISDLEADKQSRKDFATSKVKWKTGKPKFLTSIASAEASQGILDTTAQEIKKRINSWSTQYGASLSGLPGTEARALSNLINTYRAHSAFSTLTDLKNSGGTLGAISEAELTLLEAKLGAIDQKGDSSELIRAVDQISAANKGSIQRLRTEFNNTNKMYDGTYDDFEASQDDLSDEELLNKYT
jgi:hypothetical protein